MGRFDKTESASSEIAAKGQADIVICIALYNLPHIYYNISIIYSDFVCKRNRLSASQPRLSSLGNELLL